MSSEKTFAEQRISRRAIVSGVYAIIHSAGHAYIGSSRNVFRRWARHVSDLLAGHHKSPALLDLWRADGPEAFTFIVLETCHLEDLVLREQAWIDAFPDLLNTTRIARNPMLCELGRARHRIAMADPKYRSRMSEVITGLIRSPETRERLSVLKRGKPNPRMRVANPMFRTEVRAKFSAARMGHAVSVETRQKISEANKGNNPNPIHASAMGCAWLGRKRGPQSEEHKKKIIESRRQNRLLKSLSEEARIHHVI